MASKKQQKCKGSQKKSSDENTGKLIRENMKCPVCMEVLLPPIYQCETGHNICSYCIEEVHECPLCKGDYGDTRNYFAEELVNSMSFPCKFEEYGCDNVLPGSLLKDHQEICQFQPYRCPELACQEVCGLNQMGNHLDKHGFTILLGDVQEASFDVQDVHFDRKTEYNPWRFKVHNTEFYIISTRQKDGAWYFWTYCLGTLAESKKFSCEIIVSGNDRQCVFRGPIHSLRTQPDEIIETGNCLILTDNVIKSMRENGKIMSRVRLIEGKNWKNFGKKSKGIVKTKKKPQNKHNPQKTKPPPRIIPMTNPSQSCPVPGSYVPPPSTATPSRGILVPSQRQARPNGNGAQTLQPYRPASSAQAFSAIRNEIASARKAIASRSSALSAVSEGSRRPITPLKKTRSDSINKVVKKASSKAIITKNGSVASVKVSKEQDDFVLQMREALRCPGCADIILPPVHMCSIGHSCCLKCKLSRHDCAICRAPINQTRNFFAEELLYKLYQKCMYEKLGCPVCLPSAQMRLHESTCDFAPFECPFPTCRKLIIPSELLSHLHSHDIQRIDETATAHIEIPKHTPAVEPVCALPCILMKYGVGFLPVISRNPNGSWTFFVTTQDPKEYCYEISISKMSKVIAFQGPVVSLRMNQTEVEKNGLSLLLTENSVRSFKNQDKFSYSVKVFRNTENPKSEESLFGFYATYEWEPRSVQMELFANTRTSVTPKEDDDDTSSSDDSSSEDDDEDDRRTATEVSCNQTEEEEEEDEVTEEEIKIMNSSDEFSVMQDLAEEIMRAEQTTGKKSEDDMKLLYDTVGDFMGDSCSQMLPKAFPDEVVDDAKVMQDLADYEKLISISDTEETVKKVKSMMLFGQDFEASFVEKPKSQLDKNVELTSKTSFSLSRTGSCSRTVFATISLGGEGQVKNSCGSQTELVNALQQKTSQTQTKQEIPNKPTELEPNALELQQNIAGASTEENSKPKESLYERSLKTSLTKLEQIKGRTPERRTPERKSRSKLRKSLDRLKKSVSSTSSSTALALSRPNEAKSRHNLPVTQSNANSKCLNASAVSRTQIIKTPSDEEGIMEVVAQESWASIDSVKNEKPVSKASAAAPAGKVKGKKPVGKTLLVAGNGNVTVLDLESESKKTEDEDGYSSILLNTAAENMDKVVDIVNEGVEDMTGIVFDSLTAIKSGMDLLGNLIITGTFEAETDTDTEAA